MGFREDAIFVDFLRESDVPEWLFPGWPRDKDGDSIDIENLIVIGVSAAAGVEFCCGGDWQDPRRLLLTPDLRVVGVDGPTSFGEIETDAESLSNLVEWLGKNASLT